MKTHAGRKLSRTTGERNSLLRSQASSLLKHEQIKTTYAKAREVSRFAEGVLAQAKRKTLASIRGVAASITDKSIQKKIYDVLVPRYQTRHGGVTRVVRLGQRMGDGAQMAVVKLLS